MPDSQGTATIDKPATTTETAGSTESAGTTGSKTTTEGEGGEGTVITKAAGTGEGEGKPKTGEEGGEKKPGAPEKYADFKVPEGVTVNPETLKTFQEKAKALNLTQEQAQEFVDLQSALVTRTRQEAVDTFNKLRGEWKSESEKLMKAQPEKSIGLVAQARDKFATPELIKILDESGLGDHPEMVRLFIKLGGAIADDTVVDGGKGGGERSAADVLYPSQGQK